MSLKYITSKKYLRRVWRVRGWFLLRGAPKGYNPSLGISAYFRGTIFNIVCDLENLKKYESAYYCWTTYNIFCDSENLVDMKLLIILPCSI